MWINFESKQNFAVKVYVGGVNAVSGEPSTDTGETRARRYKPFRGQVHPRLHRHSKPALA
jgi:hypothetical protein